MIKTQGKKVVKFEKKKFLQFVLHSLFTTSLYVNLSDFIYQAMWLHLLTLFC